MAKAMYIDTLQIEREAELNDNFAVFEGVMTSDRLNTKGFKWTAGSHASDYQTGKRRQRRAHISSA